MGLLKDSNLFAGDSIALDASLGLCNAAGRTGALAHSPYVPCTHGQGTGLHSLTFKVLKTGLTPNSTDFCSSSYSSGHKGDSPANVKLEGPRGPCNYERQELHVLYRVVSGQAPEAHRTCLCAARSRRTGAHRQHYGDGCGGFLFEDALESRQLQRSPPRSGNPQEAVSATTEHGERHQPAPRFAAVPGYGSGHDVRGAPVSSRGFRSE